MLLAVYSLKMLSPFGERYFEEYDPEKPCVYWIFCAFLLYGFMDSGIRILL